MLLTNMLPTIACTLVKDLTKCQLRYQPSVDRRRLLTIYPAEEPGDWDLICRQRVDWHVVQVSICHLALVGIVYCWLILHRQVPKAHIHVNTVNYLWTFTLFSKNDFIFQAVPLSRQSHLLELAISRLQDKSSIVRKNAIQLLKTYLICNPFGAQVSSWQNAGSFQDMLVLTKEPFPCQLVSWG